MRLTKCPDSRGHPKCWSHIWVGTLPEVRIAAMAPLDVSALQLLSGRRSIVGWPSGTAIDSEDTMHFSALAGVRSMNEIFALERAAEAYERMMSG